VINPGILTFIPSEDFVFECPNCCKFYPNECPGNDINPQKRRCELVPALTFSESISLNVSGSITISIYAVEAKLEAGIGVVRGSEISVSLTCPIDAPKCKNVACKPRISYLRDRLVRVDHEWTMSGTWMSWGCPCPIAGNPWVVSNCRRDSSWASGNKLVAATCGNLFEMECPPRTPCPE
jgi:hypothetical protein